MLRHIVQASLKHRATVVACALLVLCAGYAAFRDLTIEAFPDPTDTQVNVITRSPGQPAQEMERQVSIPIERAVNGMPGLARVRALNLFGLSFVTLTFRDGIDVMTARAQTIERLRLASLPEGTTPQLGSLSTPIGEIFRYTVKSRNGDPLALRTLNDWTIVPQLLRVDGVADVVSYGGLVKQILVRPDPRAMAAHQVTVSQLVQSLEAASDNAAGGVILRGPEQLMIRGQGLFQGLQDIRRVAVTQHGGTPVRMEDLASVQVGWAPRQGIVSRDTDPDSVEGIVLMRRGENPSAVLARVRQRVEHLQQRVLPADTKISVFYDRTELVSQTLQTVGRNLLEGAVLVVGVLFVFLLDLRAALIVASIIPLSLCVAFVYLGLRGMPANLISMGAVDFGIIVDGAVVIVEAIVARLSGSREDKRALTLQEQIAGAVHAVARPTLFALLIIIAAYVPIFLLQRVEGRIFAPMAHTVVSALVGSLAFSLTLVPALATFAYRVAPHHREPALLRWLTAAYERTLRAAMRKPAPWLLAAALGLAASSWLLSHRGTEFLPELNEGALYLTFTLPSNASLDEGRLLMPQIGHMIDTFPEVEAKIAQLGRPEDGTDPTLSNNLEFFVKLRPQSDWPKDTPSLGALIAKMQHKLGEVPGLEVNFSQPIRDNVNENISGQFGQIALKLFGDDMRVLQDSAERAKEVLSKVQGVADLGIVKSGEVPELRILPDRDRMGRYGLTMDDVQSFLSTALGGKAVGQLWEGERVFDVVLRFPATARDTPEAISELRIPTHTGALIPLLSVADVDVTYGRASINRENGQRYIGIRMNVRGRDLGSFMADARVAVDERLGQTRGVQLEWGGEFESKERAMNRLLLVVPVALLLTLGLLFNAFGSMALALLVLLTIPFALVGGAVGLWAFDMPLSIAAAVGFIALVGQASLNGVLVLSAIHERRRSGVALDEAICGGARERLRAVLMTACLAALGLLPAAFSKAMGAETQRPIAVVIVGGTASAALLTLLVLPLMYRLLMQLTAAARARAVTTERVAASDAADREP